MSRLRKLGSDVGGMIDGAVLRALRHRFTKSPSNTTNEVFSAGEHDRRAELLDAITHYESPETRASFFGVPPHPDATTKTTGSVDHGRVLDLAWPSAYVPSLPSARDAYLAWERNRGVHARAFLHDTPARTAVICLHGYQGGSFFVDERAFSARWLYALGCDVVLFALPFHGLRKDRHAPSWPAPNPVRSNEGFGQAIFDLRALVKWLRARPGAEAQKMAVLGISLGGYTASLFATTDALDFVGPMVPVASWPELLWSHGEGRAERDRAEKEGITLPLLQRAMALVSPLERTPLVSPDQVLVQSARGDRIAPPEHALRLAQHFGGVHLAFAGGHVLQLGRRDAYTAIAQRMALLGLIDRR
ncbi:MAG: prolyl oligopeptidase family serine peptidase [Polyangia bacterium]